MRHGSLSLLSHSTASILFFMLEIMILFSVWIYDYPKAMELILFSGGYAETVIRYDLESSKCVLRAILCIFQSFTGIWVSGLQGLLL